MGKEETEKYKCGICNREFKGIEALTSHNAARHPELASNITDRKKTGQPASKKLRNWSIFIVIFGLMFLGIYFTTSNAKTFPPTDINGHIEANPASHVLREPMPIAIQKHMLEHADGVGRPGVIINYNCEGYGCEEGLVENLETFASQYDYVYVAPFKNMDAKIALTKLDKIEILEEYEETTIKNFIEGF